MNIIEARYLEEGMEISLYGNTFLVEDIRSIVKDGDECICVIGMGGATFMLAPRRWIRVLS